MPELTRRRYPERHDCWHVYYGDVHVGTLALRTGIPHDEDPWEWLCGFYPGSEPGEYTNGTGAPLTRRAPASKPPGARPAHPQQSADLKIAYRAVPPV